MVLNLLGILMLNALALGFILIVLLIVMAAFPPEKGRVRKNVKDDLGKIKDQINGDE
jgi:hypothetical protein